MRRARVRVPATSANIGPGFDCLGLGLDLYNFYEIREAEGLVISGCAPEHSGEDNLFLRAFRRGMEELGLSFKGARVAIAADIPVARGLGSSSACIVGGLMAASAFGAREMGQERMLGLATEMEGHPDNVAAALLGGFVVSVADGQGVATVRALVSPELTFCALVPPFALETVKARAALPRTVEFADAAYNAGRSALVTAAFLGGDYGKLATACGDRLHQPYRSPLIPGYDEVLAAARDAGAVSVYLSGAGPTIMAICDRRRERSFAEAIGPVLGSRAEGAWRLMVLHADNEGARLM
ncbi:MAG TPA: homoserine kinase [Rectinemataceae bacterium]|nr:homoserine kinase [Rectinemataceae bacterium]